MALPESGQFLARNGLAHLIQLIKNEINTEKNNRISGDTALDGRISSEITARTNADTTLQTNINNEASTRSSQDTALSNRITTLENTKVVKPVNGTSDYKIQISNSAPTTTDTNIITFVI